VRAYDLIKQKRDGGTLADGDIAELIAGISSGAIPDYQTSALLMAIFFRGLSDGELAAWCDAMLHSGDVIDLSSIPGRKVDKHSTGGVGDKVSICLAPLVAACGVPVPMVSGRGLGHTGGTLDKLRAIPGFRVDLSVERYRELVQTLGACLIGQTDRIAPADRKLYALRDVTATVESIPLIAASIMSKKLAEGIDALLLDVKVGRGAFMKTEADARKLAAALIGIGKRMKKDVVALLTDMDQPLGLAVGNALEVNEAVAMLEGGGPTDLRDLTLAQAAEMLVLGRVCTTGQAAAELRRALESGAARQKFAAIVEAQGGDPSALDRGGVGMPVAPERVPLRADRSGFVAALDAEKVGLAAVVLGAGRATLDEAIDPAVGVTLTRKRGDQVAAGDELCVLHLRSGRGRAAAEALLREAFAIADGPPGSWPLVLGRLD
jgi:pyrimidine-nucleoside phosphorylase